MAALRIRSFNDGCSCANGSHQAVIHFCYIGITGRPCYGYVCAAGYYYNLKGFLFDILRGDFHSERWLVEPYVAHSRLEEIGAGGKKDG